MLNAQSMSLFLNSAYQSDPAAISSLFGVRRICNKELSEHPYVQVFGKTADGPFWVSLIGLINGMLQQEGSADVVAVIYDDDTQQNVLGFKVIPFTDVAL